MAEAPSPPDAELNCPKCRSPLTVKVASARTACRACETSFECVFVRPPAGRVLARGVGGVAPRAAMGVCVNHSGNPATARCRQCQRWICDVCTFRLAAGKYCPDCSSRPADVGSGSMIKAVASIGLAILAGIFFFGFFIWAGSSHPTKGDAEAAGMALSFGLLVTLLPGMALGFMSRDDARRKGSPLAIIGIVLNLLLLGVFVLLMVIGMMSKG